MRAIYEMTAPELVTAMREQQEKSRILHEERIAAYHAVRDAQAQHDFLESACRTSERNEDEIMTRLREVIRREAYEMAS